VSSLDRRLINIVKKIFNAFGFEVIRLHNNQSPTKIAEGSISEILRCGRKILFFVVDPQDSIQKFHAVGRFYEEEELELIGKYFHGGLFLDVGANVGNHAVFALKFLKASKVVAFEPNPVARKILLVNIALNELSNRVEIHPLGLSDRNFSAAISIPTGNMGGARLEETDGEDGVIAVRSGDPFFVDRKVDFIKIDAEGCEISVLSGLGNTISRDRPTIFVEVDEINEQGFRRFLDKFGYSVAEEYGRYANIMNYLILPDG